MEHRGQQYVKYVILVAILTTIKYYEKTVEYRAIKLFHYVVLS
jgi:hypothetical protein